MAVRGFKENDKIQTKMTTRSIILKELRERGCRITSQRRLIIDIILENKCSCCKEIYYQAVMKDKSIGIATVYRMLKLLEEIGAIDRSNMYQIQCDTLPCVGKEQIVFFGDNDEVKIIENDWLVELKRYLKQKGFIDREDISVVIRTTKPCVREEVYYD